MKTISHNGITVRLKPRTYRTKLERFKLNRRFLGQLPEKATQDERDVFTARSNFLFVLPLLDGIDGAPFTTVTAESTESDFEAAFGQFLDLDEDLVDRVLAAVDGQAASAEPEPEKNADGASKS